MTTNDKPLEKRPPVTKYEAGPLETKEQRFERYLRQLSRCVLACNLCKLGNSECFYNNTYFDPHCPNPFKFTSKIMFLKFSPDEIDISSGLFSNVKQICEKFVNFELIYKTVVNKCYGEADECPYFDLEFKASGDLFKLIIIFDKESADKLGVEFVPGQLDKNVGFRTYCCDDEQSLIKILKLIKLSESNSQIHSSLFA
jgi:hypothetical protein